MNKREGLDLRCRQLRARVRPASSSWFVMSILSTVLAVLPLNTALGAELAVQQDFATKNKELYQRARKDVLDALSYGDADCENWRRLRGQGCSDASDCGKGWLLRKQGLILALPGLVGGALTEKWEAGQSREVKIIGLRDTGEDGGAALADCESSNLTMLLRLQGPEALAETAVPVAGQCAWTVQFQPTLGGKYKLDATVIEWKGSLEPQQEKCNAVGGAYGSGSVRIGGVTSSGGPFYGAHEGCCTLCTRLEGCVAWSATDRPDMALVDGDRCVLYSSVVGKPVVEDEQQGQVWSGTARDEESMTYLGPSMDMDRSWCAQRNTEIFGSGVELTVLPGKDVAAETDLPLCRGNLLHDGRWVKVDEDRCRGNWRGTIDGWPKYSMTRFTLYSPEECYLVRDKPLQGGPVTPTTLADPHAPLGGYVYQPYDCRYDLMSSRARMQCLAQRNVTRFLDFGDSLITTSREPRTTLFMPDSPGQWARGTSRKHFSPGAEEDGCSGLNAAYYGVDRKSGTRYCGAEAYWQLPVGQLQGFITSFSPDVVLANWSLVHRLWHQSPYQVEQFLKSLVKNLDEMQASTATGTNPRFKFWLPLPYIVSEREPHCVHGRAGKLNAALREVLEPRGWIEVNWPEMTRKWSLDIADGVHHGPATTRMMAFLIMHHICHGDD